MAQSVKSMVLQPCGPQICVSPANSDVTVHIDEKTVRLAALGFATSSRPESCLSTCLFLGSVSTTSSTSIIDVYADRYDCGQVNKYCTDTTLFPEPSVCLGQDDVVIPCFLNRRISKSELKQLSSSNLFPSIEDRGFSPSLRDIIACCISLRLSAAPNTPRSPYPSIVTRADLRISIPTNAATFTPVAFPSHLFGGINVADLLPPIVSAQAKQTFRAGFISLRTASTRLASSIGFLLDADISRQTPQLDSSLVGVWITGCNASPAEDLRVYSACLRYAFDSQLSKYRLLPSHVTNHRAPPSLPFASSQTTPYFLLAIVSPIARSGPTVSFYECRISPTLAPSFTILTATTLLPPPSSSGDRQQMLKLDFVLGRAASVAVGDRYLKEALDDSADDQIMDEDEGLHSEPSSTVSSLRRKPPQPQLPPSFATPSVPDVSLWLPPVSGPASQDTTTPRQFTALSTPRISSESRVHAPVHADHRHVGSKSAAASVSSFEDEWRQMREKVELMWQNAADVKVTAIPSLQSSVVDAAVITSPPQMIRSSITSATTKISDVSDGNASARTLRDACVGVGTSLLMLTSPKSPAVAQDKAPSVTVSSRSVVNTDLLMNNGMLKKQSTPVVPQSNSCSQCCSRDDLASVASRSTRADGNGCCLFPRWQKEHLSEKAVPVKEKAKTQASNDLVTDEKDSQYDPCSLILKWLQRCGNDTAASSVCGEGAGIDGHSHCSSEDSSAVKTAAAICTYLNGDSTIGKTRIDEVEEEDNGRNHNFVSLASSSSASLAFKSRGRGELFVGKPSVPESHSVNSSWTVHSSVHSTSGQPAENSDSFAARAREIVRQMDEWGLAPGQVRSHDSSATGSTDVSRVCYHDQVIIEGLTGVRASDMSMASCSLTDSIASSRNVGSKGRAATGSNQPINQGLMGDDGLSIALPRVVALESLRLGPTNTTLVMKNLASKHLAASLRDNSAVSEENSLYQKPPKSSSATCINNNNRR